MWMQSLHHIHTCMQYLSDTYKRYNPLKHVMQELLAGFCNIMDSELADMHITVNQKQAGLPRRGQGRMYGCHKHANYYTRWALYTLHSVVHTSVINGSDHWVLL